MIENIAEVVRQEHDHIWLQGTTISGCARCDAGRGCGGGIFGKLVRRRMAGFAVPADDWHLQAGDVVVVGLTEGVLLRATLLTYLLPLTLLFAGGVIGQLWFAREWASIALAGLGLVAGIMLLRPAQQQILGPLLQPRILRRADSRESGPCFNA